MAFGGGIVSTGRHPGLKVAPAMGAASGAELVAVYSRDQGRADAFAQRHGARAAYSKLGDLLGDSRVDGVFVSSPNALHAEHVVQAAQAGKHVLCEKPMATTVADAVRMVQACRRAGVTLGVAFHLRQHRRTCGRARSWRGARSAAWWTRTASGRSACAAGTARHRATRSTVVGRPSTLRPSGGGRRAAAAITAT